MFLVLIDIKAKLEITLISWKFFCVTENPSLKQKIPFNFTKISSDLQKFFFESENSLCFLRTSTCIRAHRSYSNFISFSDHLYLKINKKLSQQASYIIGETRHDTAHQDDEKCLKFLAIVLDLKTTD